MPPRSKWALLHIPPAMQESRDKRGWKTNAHTSQTREQCWLSARSYSRRAPCPASWALAALHTAILTHVCSRDNDLFPLLKGPQVPTGKTRLQISKGTNPMLHFPKLPLFRLNLPPGTNSNHLPSIPVQGNWLVPMGAAMGAGSTIPPTWEESSSLTGKAVPH